MCGKKEGKRGIPRECWVRQWTKEATLPDVINCRTILFLHMMSCHAKLRLPTVLSIPKASLNVLKADLMFEGVFVDPNEDCED